MVKENFESIRPYNDSEINDAMRRISCHPMFATAVNTLFPDKTVEEFQEIVNNIRSVREFQSHVMYPVLNWILARSVNQYSYEGLQHIPDKSKGYLFISNHRDIVLDSFLLQKALQDNEFETTEITFGSNLMYNSFITDVGKSNKMFTVIRDAAPKDFLHNSKHLSAYIRHVLRDNLSSVWIAQRNGRTKDGTDKTDQGLIKMLSLSGSRNFPHNFSELNLTPISISYEFEPCDYLKVREIYLSRKGPYKKTEDEDLVSILTGIKQHKGNIHLSITAPVGSDELAQIGFTSCNPGYEALSRVVDRRIINSYKLWNNNYIAADILSGSNAYAEKYSKDEKLHFIEYLEKQLSLIRDIEDYPALKTLFLELYANPVKAIEKQTGEQSPD